MASTSVSPTASGCWSGIPVSSGMVPQWIGNAAVTPRNVTAWVAS